MVLFGNRYQERISIAVLRCLAIVICLVAICSSAIAQPVEVDGGELKRLDLTQGIEYYRDESAALEFSQIRSLPLDRWHNTGTDVPSFGFDPAAYWLRFQVHNKSAVAASAVLEIAYPILDDVRLYVGQTEGALQFMQLGDRLPFQQRPLDHANFAIPLELTPNSITQLYLRVHTESSVQVPLILWNKDAFYQDRQGYLMGQGLYFGMLLVMIFYNLFIFITVRHLSYVYYAGSVLGIGLFMAALHGFGFQYLWPSLPSINEWAVVAALGGFGSFACAFTISLLQLQRNSPRFYYLILTHVFLYALVLVCAFVLPYKTSIVFAIFVGFSACVSALLAGGYTLYRGLREARYYVLAYSSLMVASIIIALNKVGVIPRNFFTENAMQISSMMEVILLSFALADRINQERRQKYEAQQRALENEKLARDEHERYLEVEYSAKVEELRAQQKLIEAEAESRAKSEFLATMSHEIRTPMNGVLGMAGLLEDTRLNAQQQQYLKVISSSGKALLNIINDILDYSKIAAGKMELEKIDIDLEALCLECASVFFLQAQQQQLEFLCSIKPGTPAYVKGDPTRIRQILLNLLGNAFKFTRQGSVTLRVEALADTDNHGALVLRFAVQDTGIGITNTIKSRLFQAFVQADSTTTRQFGGTGLGLTISQRLIEMMGGAISVESAQGEGSTFHFTIACDRAGPERKVLDAEAEQALRNTTVLLVDRSQPFLDVMQEQACGWGVKVQVARTANDAFSLLQASVQAGLPIGVVVVNSSLPDGDGAELCQRIAADAGMSGSRCIVMKSLHSDIPALDLNQAGVDLVMHKPVMGRQLQDALLDVLLQRGQLAPQEPTVAVSDFSGKRVLVVEDNAVNQVVVSKLLQKLGIACDLAANGKDALAMLMKDYEQYDVVLMDCEMPVMDGYQATSALRLQESKLHQVRKPVIALTAHVLQEHKLKAQQAGMDDFLCKPLEYKALEGKLRSHLCIDPLDRKRSASAE